MHASAFLLSAFLSLASAFPTTELTKVGNGIIKPGFVAPEGHKLVNVNGTWALSDFNGSNDMNEIAAMVPAGLKEMGLDNTALSRRNNGGCSYKPGQCDEGLGPQEYCVSAAFFVTLKVLARFLDGLREY
jgi:hypothetical protein